MKEIELKKLRKRREKHFLQEDGTIIAKVYGEDIHFKKGNEYKEIDNTLVKENGYYTNNKNEYKVYFKENSADSLMKVEENNHFLEINLLDNNNVPIIKKENTSKLTDSVVYEEVLNGIDLEYKVLPTKVKENIIIKNKNFVPNKLCFSIKTNLQLEIDNKIILAKNNGKIIFTLDAPYMIDANNNYNKEICYNLIKLDEGYKLELVLDKKWLDNATYPVVIDPTITNRGKDNSVEDTYIYPGDANVDRNSQDILKAGVERVNGNDIINRTLIKFELPEIATGSQIIQAYVNLIAYPLEEIVYGGEIVTVHKVTEPWTEANAKWETMHDKFDSRIEGAFPCWRGHVTIDGEVIGGENFVEITNLVKKWYSNEPNNGIMLKMNEEMYKSDIIPIFFSKNNNIEGENPKPYLSIMYRNQNGLEDYMDYKSQNFSGGTTHINSYNGNLTGVFNVGSTIKGKLPVNLNLIYNTNDVILKKDNGFGKGYKLNLQQTIKEETIDERTYLEYIDDDGTIHYFYKNEEANENIFFDEDGLDMTIQKYSSYYELKDKTGNKIRFNIDEEVGYLSEISDIENNKITITYNSDKLITQIKDANDCIINLSYEENKITITNPDNTVYLNKENGKIINITKYTGITSFTYNSNDIITSITDESGKKLAFEYYEQLPYRAKKVIEYGLNNTLGNYFEIIYDFNSTTIIDNKNKATTMVFNNFGNIASTSNLKVKDDITNAYGIASYYGEQNYDGYAIKNKLLESVIPVKYVKNYLSNTSFEDETINFTPSTDVTATLSTECAETGFRSLKLVSTSLEQSMYQSIIVPKGKDYTFSAYIKNDNNVRLSLNYIDVNNQLIESISETITENDEFYRYDVTINYSEDATSELFIKMYLDTIGTVYVDDIQLEEGEVANNYNMLENSDFSNGISDWNLNSYNGDEILTTDDKYEIVNVTENLKALKVKMNPAYTNVFDKEFKVCGKEGDTFTVSFWYKNEGFVSGDSVGAEILNNVTIMYMPVDEENGSGVQLSQGFNPNDNTWQFFSQSYVSPCDFKSVILRFIQISNANNFYITNMSLFKDIRSVYYNYDNNGNLTGSGNLSNELTNFQYDENNQLIKMVNPRGNNLIYEYDKTNPDRVINGVSDSGLCDSIKYDEFGNPILTRTSTTRKSDLVPGFYKIRLKGSNKYLIDLNGNISFKEDECSHCLLYLQKSNDCYRIRNSIILNRYIKVENNNVIFSSDNSWFEFIKKEDASYLIKLKETTKYLKYNNDNLEISEFDPDDRNFEFYIETDDDIFLENNAEYTEDGKFIKNTIDSLFNKTIYDIDTMNGLTKSITNAKGIVTNYTYDDKKRVTKIKSNNKEVNYTYDEQNKLSKIIQGKKEYRFSYDDFLNLQQIKIGDDITLLTNNYEENNGNLSSCIYGNNQVTNYIYDEYDRIKTIAKMNDNYNFKYNNNGDLVKIVSNNDTYKYTYDLGKRLREYRFNDFKIKYTYDSNGNVVNIKYNLGDINHNITKEYDQDDALIKTILDGKEVDYEYDELGRVKSRCLGNLKKYNYVSNGKRTSLLVQKTDGDGHEYSYKYDKLNNITHIYDFGILINKYYYDEYNQLIKEHNYKTKETIKYIYDNSGNLLSKKKYDLNNYNFISEDLYEYNNSKWEDQLTKFNNDIITYDEMGNTLTIGNDKVLSWINGRQLNSYTDSNNTITYKYNRDGRRTSKIVNGVETKYYVEGNSIILEQKGENVLYYLRDEVEGLIGFKYNNELYYYQKNNQGDIVGINGIIDGNEFVTVLYEYDSWGNILSITDELGRDISHIENHIGNINPFRYRGYYYDVETKLYYINSRYYNPIWGRFINIDPILGSNQDLNSYNLYSYVSNNPINMIDPTGTIGIILGCFIIGAVAGGLAGGIIGSAKSKAKTGKVSTKEVVKSAVKGAVGGGIIGVGVGAIGYTAALLANPQTRDTAQQGYNTFSQLKKNMPAAQPGNEIHHIVEQSQITKSGFDPKVIHNINNVVEIPATMHHKISGFYSSIKPGVTGTNLKVRDWLAGQPYGEQYEFGIKVIEMFRE